MLAKDSRILKENEFHPVQLRVFFVMDEKNIYISGGNENEKE